MPERNDLPKDLLRIEKRLQAVLQPIQPPALFVKRLRMQLDQEMDRKITRGKMQTGLLVAGGLVSLIVLIVSLVRSLMTWPKVIESLTRRMPKVRKREGAASI